jgi:peptide/nickel transport system substrate-binding protein
MGVRSFTAALLAAAGLVSAFSPEALAQQPKRGGTVHITVQPKPPMLMQGLNQNGPTNMVAGCRARHFLNGTLCLGPADLRVL